MIIKWSYDKHRESLFEYADKQFFPQLVTYIIDSDYRKAVNLVNFVKDELVNAELGNIPELTAFIAEIPSSDDYDKQMYYVKRAVMKKLTYKTEMQKWKKIEYWESLSELVKSWECDCETGALLMYVCARLKGIPANRLYMACGDVTINAAAQTGGHCFVKETKLRTIEGVADIQTLTEGDFVLTHAGNYKKIEKTSQRIVSDDFYEIYATGMVNSLKGTSEHPILTLKTNKPLYELNRLKHKPEFKELLTWKPLRDMKKHDYVLFPIDDNVIDSDISDDEAKLFGYYLGDGNLKKYTKCGQSWFGAVRFALDDAYPHIQQDVIYLIKKVYGYDAKIHQMVGHKQIIVYGRLIAERFEKYCGGPNKKSLSQELLYLNKHKQSSLLQGWINTDGCTYKNNNFLKTSISSSSEQLVHGIQHILLRLRIMFSITSESAKKVSILKRVCNQKKHWNITWSQLQEKNCSLKYFNNYAISRIRKITKTYEKQMVYNLQVEDDESYVAEGIATHNCWLYYRANEYPLNFIPMDWCYFPEKLSNMDTLSKHYIKPGVFRAPIIHGKQYKTLWFLFNETQAFKSLVIKPKVKQ
jgi:hypothetical protein